MHGVGFGVQRSHVCIWVFLHAQGKVGALEKKLAEADTQQSVVSQLGGIAAAASAANEAFAVPGKGSASPAATPVCAVRCLPCALGKAHSDPTIPRPCPAAAGFMMLPSVWTLPLGWVHASERAQTHQLPALSKRHATHGSRRVHRARAMAAVLSSPLWRLD